MPAAVQKPTKSSKDEDPLGPYRDARAAELFETYRDADVTNEAVIGPEGLEVLFTETQLDMEGPKPLLLAWVMGAKDMGRFTQDEWLSGTSRWK